MNETSQKQAPNLNRLVDLLREICEEAYPSARHASLVVSLGEGLPTAIIPVVLPRDSGPTMADSGVLPFRFNSFDGGLN